MPGKRGPQEASASRTVPLSLVSRERFFSQAGVHDKDPDINSLAVLLSSAKFLKGGVADEISLIRVLILPSLKSCFRWSHDCSSLD